MQALDYLSGLWSSNDGAAAAPNQAVAMPPGADRVGQVFAHCCPMKMNPPRFSELSDERLRQLIQAVTAAIKKFSLRDRKNEVPDRSFFRDKIGAVHSRNCFAETLGNIEQFSQLLDYFTPSDEDHSPFVIAFHYCIDRFWQEGIDHILGIVANHPELNMKKFLNAKSGERCLNLYIPNPDALPGDSKTIDSSLSSRNAVSHLIGIAGNLQEHKKLIKRFIELGFDFDQKNEYGLTVTELSHLTNSTSHHIFDEIQQERYKARFGKLA